MIPARYFPFDRAHPVFAYRVGARPLAPDEHRIEYDEHWFAETNLKRHLLASGRDYYFQALPGFEEAQHEAVELLKQDTQGRRRLESGEDPEKLEAEFGGPDDEEGGGVDFFNQTVKKIRAGLKAPTRDPKLYEMSEFV